MDGRGVRPGYPRRIERPADRTILQLARAVVTAGILGLAEFAAFFQVYRHRHVRLPIGYDAAWYVWRAAFVGHRGLGPVGTSVRPGSALLSALLGGLTGRSSFELQVLVPLVLVGVFGLAVGALWSSTFARPEAAWSWVVAAAIGGTLLGLTRLAGENVANLLLLALVVAAIAAMAERMAGRRGMLAAVVLLVAAGLAHWLFLAVAALMLLAAAGLAAPASLEATRRGEPFMRTEAGTILGVLAAAASVTAVLIGAVLRAPLQTFEVREDPGRFLPKLGNDVAHLWWPLTVPVGVAGSAEVVATDRRRGPAARFAFKVLTAWTILASAGIALGAATGRLPPHRFLALLVAVPGAIALAGAADGAARLAGGRLGRVGQVLAATLVVALLGAVGVIGWYRHAPALWIDPNGLQQARVAGRYLQGLPAERPVVFVVSRHGPAGAISVPLAERTVRAGLAPELQPRVHMYPGPLQDLLAGRWNGPTDPDVAANVDPYWEDVRPVLGSEPIVIVLRAFARSDALTAPSVGGGSVGDGVLVLRGPRASVAVPTPVRAVPRSAAAVGWALALLSALFVAGLGWTVALLGPGAPASTVAGIAPAMGAAALMLGALLAAETGVRLAGAGGGLTFAAVAAGGIALGARRWRRDRTPGDP